MIFNKQSMLYKWILTRLHPPASHSYISWFFILGIFFVAFLLITAPLLTQWGERHTGDIRKGTLLLHPYKVIEQTFTHEYATVDRVVVWLVEEGIKPTTGGLLLEIDGTMGKQASTVAFRDIPPSGIVVFTLTPPVKAVEGSLGSFRIGLYDTDESVRFIYQRDSNKYKGGELRNAQGDLAFQLRYQRPALSSGTWQWLYAISLVLCGAILFLAAKKMWQGSHYFERNDVTAAVIAGILITAFYSFLFFKPGYWVAPGDFVKDTAYVTASTDALRQGSWPLWSHLTCGGMPLLGNPESNTLSLTTLFGFFLPAERALWLTLAFEGGIAAVGAYLLARSLGLGPAGSLIAAVITSLTGAYSYRVVEGFTMIGGAVAATPWVFLGFIRGIQNKSFKWLFLSGTAAAVLFLRGDVHIIVGVIFVLVAMALYTVWQSRTLFPFCALIIVGAAAWLWATPKLLAYFEQPHFFQQDLNPYVARLIPDRLMNDVLIELLSRSVKVPVRHGEPEHWGNFGSYVGLLALILAGFGVIRTWRYRGLILVGLLTSLILSEGTLFDTVLRHGGSLGALMRVPTRYMSIAALFIGLSAGSGLEITKSIFSRPLAKVLLVVGALSVVIDLGLATNTILGDELWRRTNVTVPFLREKPLAPHFNFSRRDQYDAGVLLRSGYLLPHLCADLNAPLLDRSESSESLALANVPAAIGVNNIVLTPAHNQASDIIINERFTSAWNADHGTVLESSAESLHVIVPATPSKPITVRYLAALTRVEQLQLLLLILFTISCLAESLWQRIYPTLKQTFLFAFRLKRSD